MAGCTTDVECKGFNLFESVPLAPSQLDLATFTLYLMRFESAS